MDKNRSVFLDRIIEFLVKLFPSCSPPLNFKCSAVSVKTAERLFSKVLKQSLSIPLGSIMRLAEHFAVGSVGCAALAPGGYVVGVCSRHLYELAANCVMSQLLLRDATKSPELFDKSVKVYLNLAEAEVAKHYNFVKSVDVDSMESYKQA